MGRKIWRHAALAALICLAVAATAIARAHRPAYRSGVYAGTTAQTNPNTGKKFPISFVIRNGRISAVPNRRHTNHITTSRDACPDGTHLQVDQNAFGSAKLSRNGSFVLRAGPKSLPAVLRGRVIGSTARGTLSDTSTPQGSRMVCRLRKTTWTAKRR